MKRILIALVIAILSSVTLLCQHDKTHIYGVLGRGLESAVSRLQKLKTNDSDYDDYLYDIDIAEIAIAYGKFDLADSLLKQNDQKIIQKYGTSSLLLAENHIVYAKLYQLLEFWSKFKFHIDESIRIKKLSGLVEDDHVEEYVMLPWYYQSIQDFQNAYSIGEKSILLAKKTKREDRSYLLARAYNNHGYSYHYDMSKLEELTPFLIYNDSAQMILNDQRILDQLTQARVYHNLGNHYSFNDGKRGESNISEAGTYYKKSFDIYSKFINPYFSALNRFVYGYSYFYNYGGFTDSVRIEGIEKALDLFVEGAKILSHDKSMNKENPPSTFENDLENLFLILISRISSAQNIIRRLNNTVHNRMNAYKFSHFHLMYYQDRVQNSDIDNDDLMFLSSYGNPFYQAYLEDALEIHRYDNNDSILEYAYTQATNTKNYLSYVSSARLQNKNPKSIMMFDIQHHLNDRTAIIDLFTFDNGSLAAVITDSTIQFFELPISEYDYPAITNNFDTTNIDQFLIHSKEYYRSNLRPVIESLNSGITDLIIIPDLGSDQIPFEALVINNESKPKYLIEDYNIRYNISLPLELLNAESKQKSSNEYYFLHPLKEDSDLIFSKKLVKELSVNYGMDKEIKNKEELVQLIRKARLIHVSSHMSYGNNSFDGEIELSEGTLKQEDIGDLDLADLDLAVLHGCSSSIGKENANGFTSLGREFMKQGTAAVIQSQWDIDDRFSSELLEKFYENLEQGLTSSKALRKAKIDFLNNSKALDYAYPWNWAGMVLYGQDKSFELEKHPQNRIYYGGAFLLSIIIFLLYRRRLSRHPQT